MIVRQVYVYAFRIGLIRSFLPFRVVSLFCVTHLHALSGEKKEPGEPYRFGKALRALFSPRKVYSRGLHRITIQQGKVVNL